MGIKEGAQLAATAAQIKGQREQRLSQAEKDKIYMEIAKMGAEIQKQQFDMGVQKFGMEKEAHEFKMGKDQNDLIMSQQTYTKKLLDMHKESKRRAVFGEAFSNMDQFRQPGTGKIDEGQLAQFLLQKAGQYMEPSQRHFWMGKIQGGKEETWPKTEPEKKAWFQYQQQNKTVQQKVMQGAEIYATSLGIDPKKLKDGTLLPEEAQKIREAMLQDRKGIMELMFRGMMGGMGGAASQDPEMTEAFGE